MSACGSRGASTLRATGTRTTGLHREHRRLPRARDAPRRGRAGRGLGGSGRLESRIVRSRLLHDGRCERLLARRTGWRSGRHHFGRQLRRPLRLSRFLHRTSRPARTRFWLAHMASGNGPRGQPRVGLDGVVAQQENYKKSGFTLAYRNIRYGGRVDAMAAPPGVTSLRDVPFAMIEADDATVFPAPRRDFLRAWIGTPGTSVAHSSATASSRHGASFARAAAAARSGRSSPMTRRRQRPCLRRSWRMSGAARSSSMCRNPTGRRSSSQRAMAFRRSSKPHGCIRRNPPGCGRPYLWRDHVRARLSATGVFVRPPCGDPPGVPTLNRSRGDSRH